MANGRFAGGNGTANSPFLIEDAEDLNAIRYHLTSSFRLISNINLNIAPYNEGLGWNPINEFAGTLDGDGYIISNLYINRPNNDSIGFFGSITNKLFNIKNIVLDNVYVSGRNNVGILIGQNCYDNHHSHKININISNIYINGILNGSSCVAPIVGYNYGNTNYFGEGISTYLNVVNIVYQIIQKTTVIANLIIGDYGSHRYDSRCAYRTFSNILAINTMQYGTNNINNLDATCLSVTNTYMLKVPSNYTAPYFTQLSEEQIYTKDYSKFKALIEAKTTSGYNMFEFNENQAPTYNHERHKYVLVEYDNKNHTYKDNKWVELDTLDLVSLSNNAIKNIGEIPEKAWNQIKDKNPRIVNIVPQIMNYKSNKQSINISHNEEDTIKLNSPKKTVSRVHIDIPDTDTLKQFYID